MAYSVRIRWALVVAAAALGVISTAGAVGATSVSHGRSLILYRYPALAQTGRIELWTTDGAGGEARRLTVVTPSKDRGFLSAQLTHAGDVVYAVSDAVDGNVDDLYLVDHRTGRSRPMFSVRGLTVFATSPDGRQIAYSRELPIAGKPATFVADLDGAHRRQVVPVAASYALEWPVPGTLFLVGGRGSCWFCAVSVATGAQRSVPIPLANLQGNPAVSPRADRVAVCNLKGPAGERIYTISGKFLRNLVRTCGDEAFWSPDEQQLLIQSPGLSKFDFATHRLATFRRTGPDKTMDVLDWHATEVNN